MLAFPEAVILMFSSQESIVVKGSSTAVELFMNVHFTISVLTSASMCKIQFLFMMV
jgi:hypothetical protein